MSSLLRPQMWGNDSYALNISYKFDNSDISKIVSKKRPSTAKGLNRWFGFVCAVNLSNSRSLKPQQAPKTLPSYTSLSDLTQNRARSLIEVDQADHPKHQSQSANQHHKHETAAR